MIEKLDELKQLNEKFYDMFGRLFRNRKLLDNEKTFKFFGEKLFEQYKAEYEALRYKYELIELPELEKVKQRHYELVPRTRRPWYFLFLFRRPNRALKNIGREVYCEIEAHFRRKEATLERLEAALDKADSIDQRPAVFEEPPEEPGTDKSEPAEPAAEQKTQTPEKTEQAAGTSARAKKTNTKPQDNVQVPGQLTLDDVQPETKQKKP